MRTIGGYEPVKEVRIAETVSEYTYRAALINNGAPLGRATATASSLSPYTTIVDGSLTFGPVGSGVRVVSTDLS